MKKSYSLLIMFLLALCLSEVKAQNDPHFSHTMFNELQYNPSALSFDNVLNASLTVREQWLGYEGRPQTQMLNASTYYEPVKGGIGLCVINDKIGFEKVLNMRLSYAYAVTLNRDGSQSLTFGLGAGLINRSIKGSELRYEDAADPEAITTSESKLKADFNFGTEFNWRLNRESALTFGLAATHLDQGVKRSTVLKTPRHYYFYTKYSLQVNDEIKVIPFLMVKGVSSVYQFDLNTIVHYKDMFWGGLTYRLSDAVIVLLGYNISKEFKVGYSYDFGIGSVRTHSSGTHELLLSTSLTGFNKQRVLPRTPRIYN